MRKLTHSESEIIKGVNELEVVIADEICWQLNVFRATLYQWKRKYSGSEVCLLKNAQGTQGSFLHYGNVVRTECSENTCVLIAEVKPTGPTANDRDPLGRRLIRPFCITGMR